MLIQNPNKKLSLFKRVTRWEWVCNEYSGTLIDTDLTPKGTARNRCTFPEVMLTWGRGRRQFRRCRQTVGLPQETMNIIKDLHNVYYCMWCHRTFDMLPADGKCPYCHQDRIRLPGRYVVRNQHNVQIIKISSAGVINNMRTGSLWFQSPRIFHEYEGDGKKVRKDIHDSRYSRIDEKGYIVDKNVDTVSFALFLHT